MKRKAAQIRISRRETFLKILVFQGIDRRLKELCLDKGQLEEEYQVSSLPSEGYRAISLLNGEYQAARV